MSQTDQSTMIRFSTDGWTECLLCGAGREVPARQSFEYVRTHVCKPPAPVQESAGLAYLRNRGIGLPTSAKS